MYLGWHREDTTPEDIERESVRQMELEQILEFPRKRLEWNRQYHHMTDTFWYLCELYNLVVRRYYVCIRQYQNLDRSLRNRFIKCINIPSMSAVHMFWNNEPELLTDCLQDAFLFGAEKIWSMAQDFLAKNPYLKESIGKKIDSCLFEILENRLEWSSEGKWQDVLAQVTGFIFSENFYGNKSRTQSSEYMCYVCEDYLNWYKDAVLPMKKRDGAFCLEVLKVAPFPVELVALGTEGITQIWHDAKLRGRGYVNATSILEYAKKSVGIKDGAESSK